MSDVGLDATLSLDIRSATEQVARLERALDAATMVTVRADTREVTNEVTASIDAADTEATVTGDAASLTGDVTAAVDSADTAVTITGDASQLPGDVTAGVDAGDSNVALTADGQEITSTVTAATDAGDSHVVLTADAGSVQSATSSVRSLRDELDGARGSGLALATSIQVLASGAVVAGLYQAVQAASDLEEGITKANVVFEDGIDEIRVYGREAATNVGLSEAAALEATATFGNLFTALGSTRQEATKLAPEVVSLAADFASFNNLAVDETLEKLRSGLIGEIEPLRSLGVSFDAAAVEAKAMELGIAGATGAVSEGAKVQARWALILEQSTNAQGDFARTSDGLANQQRIFTAEVANTVTAIGEQLAPAFSALLATGRENLPMLEQLGVALGGSLANALLAVTPLLGTTASLLVALTPVIDLLASGLEAIPAPVLQLAASLFVVNRALRLAAPGITLASTVLSRMLVPTTAVTGAFNRGAPAAGRFQSAVGGLAGAITPANLALVGAGIALVAFTMASQDAARENAEVERQLDSFAETLGSAETASDGLNTALEQLIESGEEFQTTIFGIGDFDLAKTLNAAGISASQLADAVTAGDGSLGRLRERLRESGEEGATTAFQLGVVAEQMQESAQRALEAGIALGTYTEKEAQAAIAANTSASGAVNYAAALDQLKVATTEVGAATEATRATLEVTRVALVALGEAAPFVAAHLRSITQDGATNQEFVNLALAIDQAKLSEEQLGQVAAALGVPLDALQANVEGVTASVQSFVQGVQSSLPSLVSSLQGLGEGVTFQGIRDEFAKTLEAMVGFEANLAALAAFPNVQAAAAAAGPEVAAVLAQGVKDGKTEALSEMELMALGISRTEQGIIDTSTNQYAPAFAASQANAGIGATGAFVRGFQIAPHTTAQGDAAVNIMRGKAGALDSAGRGTGSAGARGFGSGIAPMPETARRTSQAAADSVRRVDGFSPGSSVGSSIVDGMTSGVSASAGRLAGAAGQAVRDALAHAKGLIGARSPSRVFAEEVGRPISEGIAVGITQSEAEIRLAMSGALGGSLQAAIDEVQAHVARGGRIFEDFSFVGASANLRNFNDAIAEMTGGKLANLAKVEQQLARVRPIPRAVAAAPAAGTVINVAAGAVVVQLPVGSTAADQQRVLRDASAAFWGTLADRRVTASAAAR